MTTPPGTYTGWHLWWLCWFIAAFGSFLLVESYALATDSNRTLSAAIWHFEGYRTGQTILQWTAPHLLFTGAFILTAVWLIGHFGWHIWA